MADMVEIVEKDADEESNVIDKMLPLSFMQKHHLENIEGMKCVAQMWRMKERMKTVSVALVLCLNVGVDPPDVVKTQPCARLECWIDPLSMSPSKALEAIGGNLQKQYERWQPRARYKQSLDPTTEEVKKLCTSLRRNAKEERVLFHYNGHGVPKPTQNGEIWVFNRTYTQYIPLSIYDLQSWMGAPSIYVYDCSNAGTIVHCFKSFACQHENEYQQAASQGRVGPAPTFQNCIQLAACSAHQVLPMNPDLPADLFTSCLTTPIKVAVRWFVMRYTSKLVPQVTLDLIDKIPGQLSDRRTMIGELNWIFTAITDTIAWNTLPRDLFQKLFRQDLLVASLFRNFLLAERILRSFDCTPISSPELPPTYQHPMWQAWDFTLDLSLSQLPRILHNNEPFQHLPFFEEQLTAFQVWLELGSEERNPPEQLPIVLQVLLSQIHRMRALELLGRFLDLGPWAVNLALSVGIFPYVLKLLQSSAKELRPLLVFIWAKILAVDNTCQADLVRDKGHNYFLSVLQDSTTSDSPVSEEHLTRATFVLACIVNNYKEGQEAALQGSLISTCLLLLSQTRDSHLKQWIAICLARLWDHSEKARWIAVRDTAPEKLTALLSDPCPEVRAAAVYALGTFINSVKERSEHANTIDHAIIVTLIKTVSHDMCSAVRKELVAALQWIILAFESAFINVAMQEGTSDGTKTSIRRINSRDHLKTYSPVIRINQTNSIDRLKRVASISSISNLGQVYSPHTFSASMGTLPYSTYGSVYLRIWSGLCALEQDPDTEVARMCGILTKYVRDLVNDIKQQVKEASENKVNASISLPPSPNRSNYLTESPPRSPPTLQSQDLQRHATKSAMANRTRKTHPSAISEETEGSQMRVPLVTTEFVPWSCKYFAQPLMKDTVDDVESQKHYEMEWRFERNSRIRKEAREEHRRAAISRLESQVFSTRCAVPPTVLQFHPYDHQIAVAGKDSFGIWDWGRGAKICFCNNKDKSMPRTRITALEWINGHDMAMLMAASDDGSVRLWKPMYSWSREPKLIAAWQAYDELIPPKKSSDAVGVLLAWEQWTQTAVTAGDARSVTLWDAESELRALDIPTGADCSCTCLDSTYASTVSTLSTSGLVWGSRDTGICMGDTDIDTNHRTGLIAAGFADGSVRLFDRRLSPAEAKVKTLLDHRHWVLGVQLRGNNIISGCVAGEITIYDIRMDHALHVNQVTKTQDMTAISIHRSADIYACGSANQNISIYNIGGNNLNVIRFHEGFMSHRIGPVSCLVFHPHRVALAAGNMDCSVNVYCMDGRR